MNEEHKQKALSVIAEIYTEYIDNIDGLLTNLEEGFIFDKYASNVHYLRSEYREVLDEYLSSKLE